MRWSKIAYKTDSGKGSRRSNDKSCRERKRGNGWQKVVRDYYCCLMEGYPIYIGTTSNYCGLTRETSKLKFRWFLHVRNIHTKENFPGDEMGARFGRNAPRVCSRTLHAFALAYKGRSIPRTNFDFILFFAPFQGSSTFLCVTADFRCLTRNNNNNTEGGERAGSLTT